MERNGYPVIVQECSSASDSKVVDKLLQRTEARIVELERKRLEKDNKSAVNEQTDYFNSIFHASRKQLQLKLAHAWDVDKELLICYFDEIIKDLQKLQKLLSDSSMFMPAYEIKVAQESLKFLQDEIQTTQNTLLPKKKFTFRNKLKSHNTTTDSSSSLKQKSISHVLDPHENTIKKLNDVTVEKYNEDVDMKDIGIHLLQNCKIILFGAPSTLFISGLTNCQVFSGPVSTSIHIENCNCCTFVIACQQLRVHNTSGSIFYTHVTSRTIVEDSSSLQFAPYNWTYCGQEKDFITAGLDRNQNNWDLVDDFNWLVASVPSPNWSLLPEDKYVSFT